MKTFTSAFILFLLSFSAFAGKTQVDSLEKVLKGLSDGKQKADVLNALCSEYQGKDPEKLQQYASQAILVSQLFDYPKGEGDAYAHLGVMFKNQGLFDTAQACHNRALELFKSINSTADVSRTLSNLGIVEKELGNFDAALTYYMAALSMIDENKDKKAAGKIYSNIGIVYKHLKQYHKALEYYQMTLKISNDLKDSVGIGKAYSNMASSYNNMGMLDTALYYFKLSDAIHEHFGDKQGLAIGSASIGDIYLDKKDPDQALYYYEKAMKLYLELSDNDGYAASLASIGKMDFQIEKYQKAYESYLSALEIYEKLKKREDIMDICFYISEVLEKLNRPAESLTYLKRHIAIKDSLFSSDMMNQMNVMEHKYQNEKKKKEIELLQQNQTSIANVRKELFLYGGIAVFLLVLVFTVLIMKGKKETKSLTEQLDNKKTEIEDLKAAIENKQV